MNTKLTAPDEMVAEVAKLFPIIEKIQDRKQAAGVARVWLRMFDASKWTSVDDVCFGPNFTGPNLVSHINVCTEGAYELAKLMKRLQNIDFDLDKIIVLGLLHDVSKLLEYGKTENGSYCYTELGSKIQHAFYGALYAVEEGFDLDIISLIISHTSQSNAKQCCREGVLFSYVDFADTDMIVYDQGVKLYYNTISHS